MTTPFPSLPMAIDTTAAASAASAAPSPSSPVSPVSPTSASSLRSRRSSNINLTLDLSALKKDGAPTPTNTLLLTNLDHLDIFLPDNLATIKDLVSQSAAIHSWAPLKSMRRIIVSFYSASDASRVRAVWHGESIMGCTCTVYYGRATPIDADAAAQKLALPDAGKLFFISPPPSPPHDWEMRLEDAPNKMVHAEDLADALAKLRHDDAKTDDIKPLSTTRTRSSTLVIFDPAQNPQASESAGLPAIAVDDFTDDTSDAALNAATWANASSQPLPPTPSPFARPTAMPATARPPVELMEQ